MALTEKPLTDQNNEKRNNVRLDEYRSISVKILKTGIVHEATMLNYSKNGMYFETDSILQPGTEIFIGIEKSSRVSFSYDFECRRALIIWKKRLEKSFHNYGYGVQLISNDDAKEKKCGNQRHGIDSRKHSKKPYSRSMLYAADNQILDGTSKNISIAGIFIKTKDKLIVGQTLILSLPSKNTKRLKMIGEVVWSNDEGFGIKFLGKLK